MDESLEDLRRRFLELVDTAEQTDSSEPADAEEETGETLGQRLGRLLVTHGWFQRQLHNCVRALIRGYGGNPDDIQEISQQVISELYDELQRNPTLNLDRRRAPDTFRSWIFGIIFKKTVTQCKARFPRRLPVNNSAEPDHAAAPDAELAQAVDVEAFLLQLPEPDRTAARLRLQNNTLEEVADQMQLTVDKVRTILKRVKQAIRRWLKDDG